MFSFREYTLLGLLVNALSDIQLDPSEESRMTKRIPKSQHRKPGPKPTGKTPARQLGRIPAAEWAELQQAAANSGLPFSVWAKKILLETARKQAISGKPGKNFHNP